MADNEAGILMPEWSKRIKLPVDRTWVNHLSAGDRWQKPSFLFRIPDSTRHWHLPLSGSRQILIVYGLARQPGGNRPRGYRWTGSLAGKPTLWRLTGSKLVEVNPWHDS